MFDRWRQNGRSLIPKKNPQYVKVHFAMMSPNGTSNSFLKFVYKRMPELDNHRVVVHYLGDETAYVPFPHG